MFFNLFNFDPKPFNQGWLPAKDGHKVYFLQYGNPNGIPVLSFHGGPGGRSRPKYAKLFNLKKYHFIQFDQRGGGMSEYKNLCEHNTTSDLIADAKRLLNYLKIKTPIIVHGCSWGSTMALLFAEAYPKLVQKIIVHSVFLARPEDADWVNKDSERFYPDLWYEMRQKISNKDLSKENMRLLFSANEADNLRALSYLGSYEYKLGQIDPKFELLTEVNEKFLTSSRIYFHYVNNKFFITDNQILDNIAKIKDIPTLIVHNRMDFCCMVKQAWDLHQAMPNSVLKINAGYGHSSPQLLKLVKTMLKEFLQRE
ncbi:MAG: alpha/beta fold hydrolase [Alphaproteobacteria bacterium]